MSRPYDTVAPKKPVNLTLNADLVRQARAMTGNLSAKVEELLTDYVLAERAARDARATGLARAAAGWKAHLDANGAFADEFSTL